MKLIPIKKLKIVKFIPSEMFCKDLINFKNNIINKTFKYRNDSFQITWDSRISYLKAYQLTLEKQLALDKTRLKTGFTAVDKEVNLSLNVIKQLLNYNDFLLKGALKDMLNAYPIKDTFLKKIKEEDFINICKMINDFRHETDFLSKSHFTQDEEDEDKSVPFLISKKLFKKEFNKYIKSRKTLGKKNIYNTLFELFISYSYLKEERKKINHFIEKKFKLKNKTLYADEYRLIKKRYLISNDMLLPLFGDLICLLSLKLQAEKAVTIFTYYTED
jgi:hypothetical protein